MAYKKQTVDLGSKGKFTVKKGAFRKAMGKRSGEKITSSDIQKGLNSSNPQTRRRAASAKGFKAMARARKRRGK